MKPLAVVKLLPWALSAIVAGLLWHWLSDRGESFQTAPRVPGADRIGQVAVAVKAIDLQGTLMAGKGVASDLPGAWPRFRGAMFDNICTESVPLATKWPASGPAKLWSVDLGEGYAGAAVAGGRVYVLDYDQKNQSDVLRCLSLADGEEIWRRSYGVEVKRNHGMSRTVPAIGGKYVVTMGPKCHVVCADAATGEFKWGIDLVADYGTKVPPWYAGQCPLIDGDRVILAPAGKLLMIAVDLETGKPIWNTPNPLGWDMTHSSIMPMTLSGKRTYVYCGSGGVAGMSADDGSILWITNKWKVGMANVPSPVVVGEDRLFLSGGYGAGSLMLALRDNVGVISPEVVFQLKPEVFGAEQQTPILYQGHIYGVIPNGQLVCLGLNGKVVWNSGAQRFGIGPYMIADGRIFLLNDTGVLRVVEASATQYRELAKSQVLEHGHESWGPMALAGGRLIARDLRRMVCLELKEARHD